MDYCGRKVLNILMAKAIRPTELDVLMRVKAASKSVIRVTDKCLDGISGQRKLILFSLKKKELLVSPSHGCYKLSKKGCNLLIGLYSEANGE